MSADLLSHIRIVLSHTSHPGNIGATARAMKTMGIASLYLINPKKFPDAEADARASGAVDVLRRARVCNSLNEALQGTVHALAVSARRRELAYASTDARSAAQALVAAAREGEVAIVFGTEMSGLTNEEILQCRAAAHIPADPVCSSLNLAAAVQVMAYEARIAALGATEAPPGESPSARHEDVENFYTHLEQSLLASGFLDPANPKRLLPRLRRMFGRIRMEQEEVNILRGMLNSFRK
ncbi:MAG: TrmJ/YjtD family RNA methyltransferase [Proteobacteria bacterium]|nr:TrmJ/YjtD family RNA methyltransferase [Pseudomonadota bacterium]